MARPRVKGIFVPGATELPVVTHGPGLWKLRLNRVEDRPAPQRLRRNRPAQENSFMTAFRFVLDSLQNWVSDVLALAASFNPMRLAES